MGEELTPGLEDYLEAIFNIIEERQNVRAIDLSRELEVSRSCVTEALKKLAEKKYINYGRYDVISITQKGVEAAKIITGKHKALWDFFENVLGADHQSAHQNACKIEHIISPDVLNRLKAFTQYIKADNKIKNISEFKHFYNSKLTETK